ncbi:MAG: DinB family protein [Phycisphaerales bacterium]|nr:DinB family protein [Phycisphaerales bacterium]
MDLLDRLLRHDAWTTRLLLERARELTDAELDRDIDIGHRTVRRTFDHLIWNMQAWGNEMAGLPMGDRGGDSVDELTARLDGAAAHLAATARAIAARGAWDETWVPPHDGPPVARTYGGTLAHVLTHSMHHRAQILYMLRVLGLRDLPEGDVLSWEAAAGGAR